MKRKEIKARAADLSYEDLEGHDLSKLCLRNANMESVCLRHADLRAADLRGADLREADLLGADLRSADLRGANLEDAELTDANLLGADLRGANLEDAAGIIVINLDPYYVYISAHAVQVGCKHFKPVEVLEVKKGASRDWGLPPPYYPYYRELIFHGIKAYFQFNPSWGRKKVKAALRDLSA